MDFFAFLLIILLVLSLLAMGAYVVYYLLGGKHTAA